MATYKLNVNGQEYQVEIDNLNASPIRVVVNGKPFQVTVAEPSGAPRSTPSEPQPELEEIYVPTVATTFVETIVDVADVPEAATPAPSKSGAGHHVTAPMPGKVLDIVAAVGAKVKQGDTLCNLEAMKMKSPIRSTAHGTIVRVAVNEGQNVSFGDVLFTLQ
ncbi:MAG: biotin/lipoyl-binding protein [Anaerolineae bacterium]|nr:biotin/lipoyl-binding protein [Anaerolineae bacterium]